MPQRFKITVDGEGVEALCEIVSGAPWTAGKMVALLRKGPIVSRGYHGMWTGREIVLLLDEAQQFDCADIRPENAIHLPIPGDICFMYFPPGTGRTYEVPHASGAYSGTWDIQLIYGRESEFKVVGGVETRNLWARVVAGLGELAEVCARMQVEGAKTFRLTATPEGL
jgi:hypothetical protein